MPEWLDKCVEKLKDVKGITNKFALCQWMKKQGRLEDVNLEKVVNDYRATIDTVQNEAIYDCQPPSVLVSKLEQYGHSNSKTGAQRVSSDLEQCKTSAINSATKVGLSEKDAKKLAEERCEEQGEKFGSLK